MHKPAGFKNFHDIVGVLTIYLGALNFYTVSESHPRRCHSGTFLSINSSGTMVRGQLMIQGLDPVVQLSHASAAACHFALLFLRVVLPGQNGLLPIYSMQRYLTYSDVRAWQKIIATTTAAPPNPSPMIFASRLAGVIYLDSVRRPYGFREDDLALLMELGQQIGLAIEKARFVSDISKVAESLVPEEE